MKQNRTKKTSLSWTPAEHEKIMLFKEQSGDKSIPDLVLRLIDDSQVIIIKEINSYDEIYLKAGNLLNQIAKALNIIQANPEKYSALINYLEKDNSKILNIITDYSQKLDDAVDAYFNYEQNIEVLANHELKKAQNKKRKISASNI
ncbi:hypothetical protein CFII64_24054 [Pseudomonas sp. CFII64]|uniref:hypothetical protein n=1 Tax=Pseudomonas sp. CFII64 TaxID=911242 RepID=UPI0003579B98|nr:hypothetical protein [Pseudomonas sp. CFII64]EPJ77217.1 hypothetical protein CFII64_24054 [Pseudomonas sp. CFII64]